MKKIVLIRPGNPYFRFYMQEFISERGKKFRNRLRLTAKGRHGALDMNRDQAKEALSFLFTEEADSIQVAAFITAMRFKGAKLPEFLGFLDAIYEASSTISPEVPNLINCNGPYDGRKNFLQLSPAAALLTSAAGASTVLHSSTDLPPKKGVTSAHVIEALGIPAMLQPEAVKSHIEKYRFGFMHASMFSHGVERLRRVRETLVYRSLLHSCEVMLNPAGAKRSIVGAAHESFLHRFIDVLIEQGLEHILTVQGHDGGDELPLKPIRAVEFKNGKKEEMELNPETYGIPQAESIPCKDALTTAQMIEDSFAGIDSTVSNTIIYNAGVRLYVSDTCNTIQDGVDLAKRTLESGEANKYLNIVRQKGSL